MAEIFTFCTEQLDNHEEHAEAAGNDRELAVVSVLRIVFMDACQTDSPSGTEPGDLAVLVARCYPDAEGFDPAWKDAA